MIVTLIVSFDTGFLLQSRMMTCISFDPVVVVTGGLGYTSEYHELGVPPGVVQLLFPDELFENVTAGLWYPGIVTGNDWLVSRMRKVSVPAVWEDTVNDALPSFAWIVTDGDWPFTLAVASVFWREITSASSDARLLLQSRSSTVIVTSAPTAAVADETYTCELFSVAVPAQFNGGAEVGTGANVGSGIIVGNVGMGNAVGTYEVSAGAV
jgi:hypothetical protein